MRKILLIIFSLFLLPLFVYAAVSVPFGGIVTIVHPCDTGLIVYVKLMSAPYTVIPFMWFAGDLPFLSHIPPHPGQYLLGMAEPAPIPCLIGPAPTGAGAPIVFHGSSI